MVDRPDMRISDGDRRAAGERLQLALNEGRLDFAEYDTRLAQAYDAKTYRDLDQLFTDLPGTIVRVTPQSVVSSPTHKQPAPARVVHLVPTPLRVLWTIWISAVCINLVVWLLVSLDDGDLEYFWPMWLLVPGAALVGTTVGVVSARAGRRPH
jgi:Domain of unknown function (DUF1707)